MFNPEPTLTTRQLAEALGVSESSLKRWIDRGRLTASRTAGGHRRIRLPDAIDFARRMATPLARPEILGLVAPADDAAFVAAVVAGDRAAARSALFARFAIGESLASLCDGPIRGALTHVGELWKHDLAGVMIEHRASVLCADLLGGLVDVLPAPSGPVAVGGGAPEDPYQAPSAMCAATLADLGYQTVNLGPNTPVEALIRAATTLEARLIWLSVMAPPPPHVVAAVGELDAELARREIALMVGGRCADAIDLSPARRGRSMSDLAAMASGLDPRSR